MNEWRFCKPKGEPPFWARRELPGDGLHGMDPLTGLMIAHTVEEREKIDSLRRHRS